MYHDFAAKCFSKLDTKRASVGGATDPRGPVRSATGGQCRRNRTCDLLLNDIRVVCCRLFDTAIRIDSSNRR